jgi:hypothetical protein
VGIQLFGVSGSGGLMKQVATTSIRARAFLVGILCVAILSYIRPYIDLYMNGSRIGFGQLPVGPISALAILVWVVNSALKAISPKASLRKTELILIFCMIFATVRFYSSSYSSLLIGLSVSPFYFATPENGYDRFIIPYIPKWFVPGGGIDVVRFFYEGLPEGRGIPWIRWLIPFFHWTAFSFIVFICLLCIATIFRHQWIHEEKLSFPVAQVPLAMIGDDEIPTARNHLTKNRLFWIGILIPLFIHSLGGISNYWPSIPYPRLRGIPIGQTIFVERPWDVLSGMTIDIYSSVIGLAYLVPSEVSLGLWFFHIMRCLELVVLTTFGLPSGVGARASGAITRAQEVGAYIILTSLLIWRARGVIKRSLLSLIRNKDLDRGGDMEPIPPRWAVLGLLLGTALLILDLSISGASWWAALGFLLIFYMIMIVLSRISTAGGCMFVASDFNPHDISAYFLGQPGVGMRNLIVLVFPHMAYIMERDAAPMPYIMNALKAADSGGIKGKKLFIALILSFLTASTISYWASLDLIYHKGALNVNYHYVDRLPNWAWHKYLGWLNNPQPTDWFALMGMAIGAGIMSILILLYQRFLWWPFHPLGMAMADSLVIRKIWFSIFLGWLAKALARRYGGFKAIYGLRPLAIGLILGELFGAAIWIAIDAAFGFIGHDVFPGFPPL